MTPFKHDVFLSFRGVDTRFNFSDHLYNALRQAGIRVFRDSEGLEKGEEIRKINDEIIEECEMFMPIFSSNYAGSKWCLSELAKMVDISKSSGNRKRMIIPVFYHVKPPEVCQQTGIFGDAFKELVENKILNEKSVESGLGSKKIEMVERWKEALFAVGGSKLSGFHVEKDDGNEAVIVQKIVYHVLEELSPHFANTTKYQVGIRERIREIMKYWEIETDHDIRMLLIHGLAGVGKTTIAKAIHDKIQSKFDVSCFVSNISETASLPGGIFTLQKQLFSTIFRGQSLPAKDRAYGVRLLEQALGRKKILIVLDDVNSLNQITELGIKQSCMHLGSRVIVTSRDKLVIPRTVWKESHTLIYEQQKLKYDQSLQLFSLHAFHKDLPNEGFEELSKEVVEATDGLPLAIEVIGSALYGECEKQTWNETIRSLGRVPNHDIHGKLKICYHRLDDHAKAIFLDTACFFNGFDGETAILVWKACEFSATISLRTLYRKSLIKIDEKGKIKMHQLLQETAWHVLRETQPNPDKRSRLWIAKEIRDVLERGEGTMMIETISLDLGKDSQYNINENSPDTAEEDEKGILETDGFRPLIKLRLLRVNGIKFVGDYQKMPKQLKFLSWKGCPMEFLPNDFCISDVSVLDLSCSSIIGLTKEKVLVGSKASSKVFANLRVLYLSSCDGLTITPNFSSCKSLIKLFLDQCHNLVEIDESIKELTSLVYLSLKKCIKLKELPDSITHLCKLEHLDISYCTSLEKLPESIHKLKSLKTLLASCCLSMKEIPTSIFETPLTTLGLLGCIKLERLPNCEPESCAETLQYLYLPHCNKLTELPENISQSRSLRYLDMKGCVTWKGHPLRMENLQALHLGSFVIAQLPDSLVTLTKLQVLVLKDCNHLQELPDSIGSLICLESLSIYGAPIRELPCSIGSLSMLQKLCIVECNWITRLPESIGDLLSLTEMVVKGSSIQDLPNTVEKLTRLEVLDLNDNSELKRLPDTIGCATNLIELRLDGTQIEGLPESLVRLQQLEVLSVRDCSRLLQLPSWVGSRNGLRLLQGTTMQNENLENMKDAGRDVSLACMLEAFQMAFGREDVLGCFVGRVLKCLAPESDKELQPREIFLNLLHNNCFEGSKFSVDCDELTYDNFLLWKLKECMLKFASLGCPDMTEDHVLSLIPSQSTFGALLSNSVGNSVVLSESWCNSMASRSAEARLLEHLTPWLSWNWEDSLKHLADDLVTLISQASDEEIREMKDVARKVGKSQLATNIRVIKIVRLFCLQDLTQSAAEIRLRKMFQKPLRESSTSGGANFLFPRYPVSYDTPQAEGSDQSTINDSLHPNLPVLVNAFVQAFLMGGMN